MQDDTTEIFEINGGKKKKKRKKESSKAKLMYKKNKQSYQIYQ